MNVNTKKQQQQEENTKDLSSSTSSSANKQGNVPPSTSMDPTPASLSSFLFLHSYSDICQCFVQGSTQETNKQIKPINKQEAH
jgi:hypothetical protein